LCEHQGLIPHNSWVRILTFSNTWSYAIPTYIFVMWGLI
jgi:hypothetical protein